MVVENIFDPEQFKKESDNEDIVGGIAALDYMKPVFKKNFPGKDKLPE